MVRRGISRVLCKHCRYLSIEPSRIDHCKVINCPESPTRRYYNNDLFLPQVPGESTNVNRWSLYCRGEAKDVKASWSVAIGKVTWSISTKLEERQYDNKEKD